MLPSCFIENTARFFRGVVLAVFAFLLVAALLLGTIFRLEHKSYFLALIIALAIVALLIWFEGKQRMRLGLEDIQSCLVCGLLALLCFLVNAPAVLIKNQFIGDYQFFWDTACRIATNTPFPEESKIYLALFPHLLGYSSFLSIFLRFFGQNPMVVKILNLILTVFSEIFLYFFCLRGLGFRRAIFAGVLWIIFPSKFLYNVTALSEPFYTCLLLAFLLLVSELETREDKLRGAVILYGLLGGALLTGIQLTRPIATIPLIALAIWLLLLRGAYAKRIQVLKKWGIFLAIMLVCFFSFNAQWNRHLINVIGVKPSSSYGYSLYVGFNPETSGQYSEQDMVVFGDVLNSEAEHDTSKAQEIMKRLAWERLHNEIQNYPKLFADKLQTMVGDDEGGAWTVKHCIPERAYQALLALSNVVYYATLLLSLKGTFQMKKAQEKSCLLLAPLYVIGLCLAHMLVEVQGRYHYSMIPMLVITAAAGMQGSKQDQSSRVELD